MSTHNKNTTPPHGLSTKGEKKTFLSKILHPPIVGMWRYLATYWMNFHGYTFI